MTESSAGRNYRRNGDNRISTLMSDDILEQCAKDLELLAEVYRKHGLADHAQEVILASENIRRGLHVSRRNSNNTAS